MDALEAQNRTIDIAVHIGHDPLRVYVMGDRAIADEEASDDDIAAMRNIVREAMEAGAIGFSTGRSDVHKTADGDWTPSSEATSRELAGIAQAFEGLDYGVVQAVSTLIWNARETGLKPNGRCSKPMPRPRAGGRFPCP